MSSYCFELHVRPDEQIIAFCFIDVLHGVLPFLESGLYKLEALSCILTESPRCSLLTVLLPRLQAEIHAAEVRFCGRLWRRRKISSKSIVSISFSAPRLGCQDRKPGRFLPPGPASCHILLHWGFVFSSEQSVLHLKPF